MAEKGIEELEKRAEAASHWWRPSGMLLRLRVVLAKLAGFFQRKKS
jgi:hypothetical protein